MPAALSSRAQPIRPISAIPPRRWQPDPRSLAVATAVLLDLLQHEQLSPVQVGNHRHIRPDTLRGIVQWREVVEVEYHRGERAYPDQQAPPGVHLPRGQLG